MESHNKWIQHVIIVTIISAQYVSAGSPHIHRLDSSESIPMTANGWRPIISSHDPLKSYQTAEPSAQIFAPLPAKPSSHNNYPVTPQSIQNSHKTTSSGINYQNSNNAPFNVHQSSKQRPNSNKHTPNTHETFPSINLGKLLGGQDIILHGNHGPIRNHGSSLNHGVKSHSNSKIHGSNSYRHPVIGKLQAHMALAGKRHKPIQHLSAASTRDEVFLAPPSSIMGAFPYFHTGAPKGIPNFNHGGSNSNNKHYILPGAITPHIEFPNHFAISNINDELIQQLMRDSTPHHIQSQFLIPKHQVQNDLNANHFNIYKQSDEFTRNLVPPPFKSLFETETKRPETPKPKHTTETVVFTPPTVNDAQIIVGKQKTNDQNTNNKKKQSDREKSTVPDNLILQLPAPHSTAGSFDILKTPKVEFEITKEKFNVFHNQVPPNYNPHPDVQNFFSSDAKVTPAKSHYSPHTYEVTEGKYEDVTQKTNFRQKPPKTRYSNQVHHIQNIDDGLSFLPTPYKPEIINPTISTHEVSTLYSAFNRGNHYNEFSPTRYPQFPELTKTQYSHKYNELSTQLSVPLQDSERINYAQNEVTTISEYEVPPLPTVNPSNYFYTVNQEVETTQAPSTERPTKPSRGRSTTIAPSSTTRSYQRQRIPSRRRRPTSRPTQEILTTIAAPTYESRATTPNYESQQTSDPVFTYNRPSRIKPSKAYKTTPAPESEILTTSVQPTADPTIPIKTNRDQVYYDNSYDEELQSKQRVRPTSFVDDFEDTEYTRNKYQEESSYNNDNRQRYRGNHRPNKEDVNSGAYEQPSRNKKKPQSERIPSRPSDEDYEIINYESNKEIQSEQTPIPRQRYRIAETTTIDENQYTIPQRYIKTTTIAPTSVSSEVTENYDITKIPENEVDSSPIPIKEPPVIEAHVHEITTAKNVDKNEGILHEPVKDATISIPTTEISLKHTTIEPTTTKANRIRGKPNRFDSNRPRFSVKEYRQRLNPHTSTTEASKPQLETTNSRLRFPTRTRLPSPSDGNHQSDDSRSKFAQNLSQSDDNKKFTPKESRYRVSTESSSLENPTTTEKVNNFRPNRLRTNGGKFNNRYRTTTTESTNTGVVPPPKVVIKPNTVFSNLKRPPPISLRTRIFNKHKMLNASSTTEIPAETTPFEYGKTDNSEIAPTTLPAPAVSSKDQWDLKSEGSKFGIEELFEKKTQPKDEDSEKTLNDMANSSSFLQSQRVADLTSLSAAKDYNSSNMFKTVSPNSRRIPNYFTIATDDPILPIEAFFPQLNHKDSNKFAN